MDNGSCPNYESSFSLSFSPTSSATITTTNCSSSSNNSNDDGGRKIGDACIESPHITFPPNVCSVTVAIELEQDKVFESREQLFMYITDCSNCVSNITNTRPITIIIDDTQDCESYYVCIHIHCLMIFKREVLIKARLQYK